MWPIRSRGYTWISASSPSQDVATLGHPCANPSVQTHLCKPICANPVVRRLHKAQGPTQLCPEHKHQDHKPQQVPRAHAHADALGMCAGI